MANHTNKIETYNLSFYPTILTDILGNKIIELDSIVFSELIKNSKDSNAKLLTIDFSNYNDSIVFIDNGDGMSLDDIKKNWLVVATNNKTTDTNTLGGKGIGRFSAFKICNKITVITRKSNYEEFEFSISVDDIAKLKRAEDLKIEIIQNNIPKYFVRNNTGTKLILEEIHELSLEEIQTDLENLILENSKTKSEFSFEIIFPSSYKKLTFTEPLAAKKLAPFKCNVSFQDNKVLKYNCSIELNDYTYATIPLKDTLSNEFSKLPNNLSLGIVNIELNSFLLDNNFIKHYSIDKPKLQKEFLDYYYGISIYRNDFKIYGFGKNDWLELNERRIDEPTKRINNKQIHGFIELDKCSSNLLEEKTSREGFIRSKYLTYLKDAIMLIIKQFENDILIYRRLLTGKDRTWIFDVDENTSNSIVKENNVNSNLDTNSEEKSKNTTKCNPDISQLQKTILNADTNTNSISDVKDDKLQKKEVKSPSNSKEESDSKKPTTTSALLSDSSSKSATARFNNLVIIDSSFNISESAPEKIKRIVYELQKISKTYNNAQALLLRCLIDISTKYMSTIHPEIKVTDNDLKGSVISTLNYMANNQLLNQKHIARIRTSVGKENVINYFNGVAHFYDYRPDYDTIKDIWNIFEPYIKICSEQK